MCNISIDYKIHVHVRVHSRYLMVNSSTLVQIFNFYINRKETGLWRLVGFLLRILASAGSQKHPLSRLRRHARRPGKGSQEIGRVSRSFDQRRETARTVCIRAH